MHVLMLGWEYPPHISGGLGTACHGLTVGLAGLGVEIDFVVPRAFGDEDAAHMRLAAADAAGIARSPDGPRRAPRERGRDAAMPAAGRVDPAVTGGGGRDGPGHAPMHDAGAGGSAPSGTGARRIEVPARLRPYLTAEAYAAMVGDEALRRVLGDRLGVDAAGLAAIDRAAAEPGPPGDRPDEPGAFGRAPVEGDPAVGSGDLNDAVASAHGASEGVHYAGDLFGEVARYADGVRARCAGLGFDLVHAHDWMTWPAAAAVARAHGVPFVAHVHSLEHDRGGDHPDARIEEFERQGLEAADRIIAVSYYTRQAIHRRYGVPLDRIAVVHNGAYTQAEIQSYRARQPSARKTVLFLGRVTQQKGPETFVRAAAKVVPHVPDVEFVVAGSGDMLPAMIQQVAELGLGRHFRFTGFLRGPEVERMFSMADLYVMPSVSEPFGIAALEAMSYDTPVIISKQSGVAEVLKHALKVDFWDVDYLANLIIGALRYPALRDDIVAMAREEVRRLHWDAAAEATAAVYASVLEAGRRGDPAP